jgi:hypothetical protein
MKKQRYLRSCFVFLVLFTFSMLIFGCGDNGVSKLQTERVESKQLKEESSAHANEADAVVINTSGSGLSQIFPVEDEIQLDEWMQLVKDIKSTLGEMEEVSKQVLQTSELR